MNFLHQPPTSFCEWSLSVCMSYKFKINNDATQAAFHFKVFELVLDRDSFRDRDLKRHLPCHTASENLDASTFTQ